MSFESLNLSNPLLNALKDLNYQHPTPIQKHCFAPIMSGRDVVALSQTGTGKTLAYILPILRMLPFSQQKNPRALIVVPTRELVLQVVDEIRKVSPYMNIRFDGVYGGTNINTQKNIVSEGLDILVATPGRLMDLVYHGVLNLKSIQKLVIDEVDELLNQGFRPQLMNLLDALPEKRQNLMFSATLTGDVENVIDTFFNNPLKIILNHHGLPLEQIEQFAYEVPNFHTKLNLLQYLLNQYNEEDKKLLVFVSTKKLADSIYESLEPIYGEKVGVIHSNKSQNQRIRALADFEAGLHHILIATDLVARGIDIENVSHVFNFDLPQEPTDYIHRIGRSGRADKSGTAISLIGIDSEMELKGHIERLMNKPVQILDFPDDVEVSDIFTPEEKKPAFDIPYLKPVNNEQSKGAFHEKKEKNKKVNVRRPSKRAMWEAKQSKKRRK